jgi:hypothetical protein
VLPPWGNNTLHDNARWRRRRRRGFTKPICENLRASCWLPSAPNDSQRSSTRAVPNSRRSRRGYSRYRFPPLAVHPRPEIWAQTFPRNGAIVLPPEENKTLHNNALWRRRWRRGFMKSICDNLCASCWLHNAPNGSQHSSRRAVPNSRRSRRGYPRYRFPRQCLARNGAIVLPP